MALCLFPERWFFTIEPKYHSVAAPYGWPWAILPLHVRNIIWFHPCRFGNCYCCYTFKVV